MALVLLLVLAAMVGERALAIPVPMELYFSPAELARFAGYGEELVSSVLVSGQVACELCLRPDSDLLTFELPGAKVAVTCETEGVPNTTVNSAFATTNEYGNFTIELPSKLHATPYLEKACSVMVIQLPLDSACSLSSSPSSSYGLRLSSAENGVRVYTTAVVRLQHNDVPSERCVQAEDRSDMR